MVRGSGPTQCRYCGKKISVIEFGAYRKIVVDPKAVMVRPDPDGEDFVRADGSKIRGTQVPYMKDEPSEPAYRMHRKTCVESK